jgi:hypothetical protein
MLIYLVGYLYSSRNANICADRQSFRLHLSQHTGGAPARVIPAAHHLTFLAVDTTSNSTVALPRTTT